MILARTQEGFQVRSEGDLLGRHRVLEPQGILPQAAWRLDNRLPIYDNELLIQVERLHLDSASFRQLKELHHDSPEKIAQAILKIVHERGKMQNPVTGSGGMLLGTVKAKGERCPLAFTVGEKIATLVSLTLTPLALDQIQQINLQTGFITVEGQAILFASGLAAALPQDFSEGAALAAFDVCGAPAWAERMVQAGDKVLILGAGKSGLLTAAAMVQRVGVENLYLSDVSATALKTAEQLALSKNVFQSNAQDPNAFYQACLQQAPRGFDLVLNTSNAPETETACLLAVRSGGRILFFNMATQFSRAVLSAEGMGKDATMIMGNGYVPGHAEFTLELLRRQPQLKKYFEEKYGGTNL